jgi:hypothetical protein
MPGVIRSIEVVAVADRVAGERSPDGGHAGTPASPPSTPRVAIENAGAKMHPIPTPRTSRPGETLLT